MNLAVTILILLKIHFAWTDDSDFTKIGKIPHWVLPFKFSDKIHFLTYDYRREAWFISTTEPTDSECRLPHLDVGPSRISVLGNGKLLVHGDTVKHFNVIDLFNCSHPIVTEISNRRGTLKKAQHSSDNDRLGLSLVYNDTFDVFDRYQKICLPCRYNYYGKRLPVHYTLGEELTSEEKISYSLELVSDAFGVESGYFYLVRFHNETTALRILDSKFKVVKQRLFDAKIEAYSLIHENLTVCYKMNPCPNDPPICNDYTPICQYPLPLSEESHCEHVKCPMLDFDLKTIRDVGLHQVGKDPEKNHHVTMRVRNLAGGGAMVAMMFEFDRSKFSHDKEIFIQQIHPNGRVGNLIRFDSLDNSFTDLHDFTFDNGEYCLVTVNLYDGYARTETLVKCLAPSPAHHDKL